MQKNAKKEQDACFGAIYGAFCGDAAGSLLEFSTVPPSREKVDLAMKMPGRSAKDSPLLPGQITDASEMAICQLISLSQCKTEFNVDNFATSYSSWYESSPVDIGGATSEALQGGSKFASEVRERAAGKNETRQGNSCLMRMAPLIVWARRMNDDFFAAAIREDVILTHPNKDAQEAAITFAFAIR